MTVDAFEATYDYVDEAGAPLFQVCRTPDKRFLQRRRNGNGWEWGLGETRRVLFALPRVLEHIASNTTEPLFVVEGEKDVLAIEAAGGVATCNPMGAGKWDDAYSEALMGARQVVVVVDRDEAGAAHARTVCASLAAHGISDLWMARALEGKDAADHLAAGFTLDEMPKQAWAATLEAEAERSLRFTLEVRTARELCALPDPPETDLLLGPLVLRGGRTIVVGDTGHGKTTLTAQLVGAVLDGREMLGYVGARAGPALFLDLEQGLRSIKRVLRETQLAARDDVLYVQAPDGLALDSDDEHRAELERIIAERRPTIFSTDPYYKAHRGDSNDERAITDLMRYLDGLRARYGFALILPAHPRKDQASSGARKLTLHDVAGSGAVVRGAEIVLAIERLSHGYARLRILKDRDGDLPVGEAWPLIFTRGEGFRLDPKEERTAEEIEARILAMDGAWRTAKEWAAEIGIRPTRAKDLLEQLAEAGRISVAIGPPGRSPKARCYSTAPETWEQSGTVTPSLLDTGTVPTVPTSIEDVELGAVGGSAPDAGTVRRPTIGEKGYLERIFAAFEAGHVTEGEWHQAERAHRFVLASDPEPILTDDEPVLR